MTKHYFGGKQLALIVNDIHLPPDAQRPEAVEAAIRLLGVPKSDVKDAYITRTSVDARRRGRISLVYSVGVELEGDEATVAGRFPPQQVSLRRTEPRQIPRGTLPLAHRPVIAGFGPAGMFAGLQLARLKYRPLIVERGADVETRVRDVARFWSQGVLNPESNVQFGEGGAGTFSDGKLVTRINDSRCGFVLDTFVEFGAPEEIRRDAKPHIGTDKLQDIVRAVREEIRHCGGEVRFGTRLDGVALRGGRLSAVKLSDGTEEETGALILAVGHSARDTFEMLLGNGFTLTPKPFSVGVRIEHLQSEIDRGLYGALAGHPALPKGEYQLSLRQGGRAVYTFCMCPGGTVVAAASKAGGVVTNGMSGSLRDGKNANAALVVSVDASDFGGDALGGLRYQQKLEQAAFAAGGSTYRAPFQTAAAFRDGTVSRTGRVEPSYPIGVTPFPLEQLLPPPVTQMLRTGLAAFDRRLPGFGAADALLTGIETRTSSPVRILRNDSLQADGVEGVYPAGEGAGYAGGIVSAAVDGLRAAEAIAGQYAPFD